MCRALQSTLDPLGQKNGIPVSPLTPLYHLKQIPPGVVLMHEQVLPPGHLLPPSECKLCETTFVTEPE
jgi:hypothetical protein